MALGVTVRIARRADCEWIYQWRNHAATRCYFFDSAEIEHRKHCAWFEKVLAAEDVVLLVVEEGDPIGVVRFNLQEEEQAAEVSVYVDPARHGAGLGKKVLAAGEHYLCHNFPGVRAITAQVMQENIASRKLFFQAGFRETDSNVYLKWVGRP